jgi:hypothetical protein
MTTPAFSVVARHADDIPTDWRDRLAQRLGQRPRRLGMWTELALYGALRCVDAAHAQPGPDTLLRVSSARATAASTQQALTQASEGFPLPFTFLQSQTSQTLAALAAHLAWTGDASFMATGDIEQTFVWCCAEAHARALLFGYVDDDERLVSQWVWLAPAEQPGTIALPSFADALTGAAHLTPSR